MASVSIGLVLLLASVAFVMADCPAKPAAPGRSINCSFELHDPCNTMWLYGDKHGVKWKYATRISSYKYNTLYGARGDTFMSLEATSDARRHDTWLELASPPVQLTQHGGCLQFVYTNKVKNQRPDSDLKPNFMLILRRFDGGETGAKGDGGLGDDDVLLREYPYTPESWVLESLPIRGAEYAGTHRLVFTALQHGHKGEYVAIDDVIYHPGQSCSVMDDVNYDVGDCDFEDASTCDYDNLSLGAPLSWMAVRSEVMFAAADAAAAADDDDTDEPYYDNYNYFVLNPARFPANRGNVLALYGEEGGDYKTFKSYSVVSPKVTIRHEGCVSLNYYSGRHVTDNDQQVALLLSRYLEDQSVEVLHEFPSTLTDDWLFATVPLPEGEYFLNFTARLRLPYGVRHLPTDVTAIDDVEVHQKSCDLVSCDDVICDDTLCSSRSQCVGRGRKHSSCQCFLGDTECPSLHPDNQRVT